MKCKDCINFQCQTGFDMYGRKVTFALGICVPKNTIKGRCSYACKTKFMLKPSQVTIK